MALMRTRKFLLLLLLCGLGFLQLFFFLFDELFVEINLLVD
jgi:hypothetical protein